MWWGLSRDTWVRIGLWTFFSLVVIIGVHSCSSRSATGNVGNGILILFFAGLIVAAVVSRERPYLALTFSGLAILVFLVLLGKFDGLFKWDVIGLLLVAAAGIYGTIKTEGRTRAFLGFASGIVILIWLHMFAQATLNVKLEFLGERVTDSVNLIIGLLAIGIFAFAAWRRNWIFFIISFAVLAAWLGPDVSDRIQERFPSQLSASDKTKGTLERMWNSVLNRVEETVKPGPAAPPTSVPTPKTTTQLPKKQLQRVVAQKPLIAEQTSGDCVSFRVDDVPWASNARYRIAFRLRQDRPGKLFVEVNGRAGDEGRMFDFDSRLSGQEIVVVFFEDAPGGLRGKATYFKPGTNRIIFRSPGINSRIHYAQIEVEYWT